MTALDQLDLDALYEPLSIGRTHIKNRFVMAPMTRMFCEGGVPGEDVVEYYRSRARGDVGLIITEGTYIDHPAANGEPRIPAFHGPKAQAGWRKVVDAVHDAGGKIIPQIWHYGLMRRPGVEPDPAVPGYSADVLEQDGVVVVQRMTQQDIDDVVAAYAKAAADAERLGFDGVELHGAHEYLIDNFLWAQTNHRQDAYGGSIENRSRFAVEVIRAVRAAIHPDFPLFFRYSQWKQSDYAARLATTPDELARLLTPLSEAGVDVFDVSTRRFWEPAFPDSDLTLAAWTKQITGKTVMAVGSVGLAKAFRVEDEGEAVAHSLDNLEWVVTGVEKGDFDLVGLGRTLLSEPAWPRRLRERNFAGMRPYNRSAHTELVL